MNKLAATSSQINDLPIKLGANAMREFVVHVAYTEPQPMCNIVYSCRSVYLPTKVDEFGVSAELSMHLRCSSVYATPHCTRGTKDSFFSRNC